MQTYTYICKYVYDQRSTLVLFTNSLSHKSETFVASSHTSESRVTSCYKSETLFNKRETRAISSHTSETLVCSVSHERDVCDKLLQE